MPFLLTYADCFLTLLMASDAIIDGEWEDMDIDEVHMWLEDAAEKGHDEAVALLETLVTTESHKRKNLIKEKQSPEKINRIKKSPKEILNNIFGFDSFLDLQNKVIDQVIAGG